MWLKNWWTENSLNAFRWRWLTCNLSEAADKQSLVVTVTKGDAVTQSVLMAMFDLMLFVSINHTQQVLLQQFRTAQHWAVVYKRCHKPDSETNESWSLTGPGRIIHTGYNNHIQWLLQTSDVSMLGEKNCWEHFKLSTKCFQKCLKHFIDNFCLYKLSTLNLPIWHPIRRHNTVFSSMPMIPYYVLI